MKNTNLAPSQKIADLSTQKHYGIWQMPHQGLLEKMVYLDGFVYAPLDKEVIPSLPAKALRVLGDLRDSGVCIQSVVIGHEAPALLPPPNGWRPEPRIRPEEVAKTAGEVAAVVLTLATVLGGFFLSALAGALMLDPRVVVILDDGSWWCAYSYLQP